MKKYLPVFIFPLVIFLFYYVAKNINRDTESNINVKEFKGVIRDIYQDTDNRYAHTFYIIAENDSFSLSTNAWKQLYMYASLGDSIIKQKDDLRLLIKKNDGSSEYFYYKHQ